MNDTTIKKPQVRVQFSAYPNDWDAWVATATAQGYDSVYAWLKAVANEEAARWKKVQHGAYTYDTRSE